MRSFFPYFCLALVGVSLSSVAQSSGTRPKLPNAATAAWGAVVVNADGSVAGWPESTDGQAIRIALPRKAVQAAVHQRAAFALLDDGTVMGWGSNADEGLGIANETIPASRKVDTPVPVPGLSDIVQITATYAHGLALRRDGAVFAWGESGNALRGDVDPPTGRARRAPVAQVAGLTGIVQVATAARHSLALNRDGHVWAWGSNDRGQLGDGNTGAPRGPAEVPGLDHVVAISAGLDTSLALKADGTVWAWGGNQSAMIGNGQRPGPSEPGGVISTPALVKGVTNVRAIAAGEGHVVVLLADGTLRAWGFDGHGETGFGTSGGYQMSPVRVRSIANVTQISAGVYRSFAVTSDGQLWHWGTSIPATPGRRPYFKVPAVLER